MNKTKLITKNIRPYCFASLVIMLSLWGCMNLTTGRDTISLTRLIRLPTDSLTQEQQDMRTELADLWVENLKVEDNMLVFKLSKKDFTRKGFPGVYYDELVNGLIDSNLAAEKMGIENLEEALEQSKASYYKKRDTWFDINAETYLQENSQ